MLVAVRSALIPVASVCDRFAHFLTGLARFLSVQLQLPGACLLVALLKALQHGRGEIAHGICDARVKAASPQEIDRLSEKLRDVPHTF